MRIHAYMHTPGWAPGTGPLHERGGGMGRGLTGESPSQRPRGGGVPPVWTGGSPTPAPHPRQEARSAGDPRGPKGDQAPPTTLSPSMLNC